MECVVSANAVKLDETIPTVWAKKSKRIGTQRRGKKVQSLKWNSNALSENEMKFWLACYIALQTKRQSAQTNWNPEQQLNAKYTKQTSTKYKMLTIEICVCLYAHNECN